MDGIATDTIAIDGIVVDVTLLSSLMVSLKAVFKSIDEIYLMQLLVDGIGSECVVNITVFSYYLW